MLKNTLYTEFISIFSCLLEIKSVYLHRNYYNNDTKIIIYSEIKAKNYGKSEKKSI